MLLHSTNPILIVVLLALSLDIGTAALCPRDPALSSDLGEEIFFESATKVSISGFSASVSYVTIASGDPYIKIIGASELPVVTKEEDALYISTGSCDEVEVPPPTTTSAATMLNAGIAASILVPRGLVFSLLFVTSLFGLPQVLAMEGVCTPSLDIEINLPEGAEPTPSYGETDHYIAATPETVVWGWYDPNASPILTCQSGETVTMEGITSVAGLDYAKLIRGDAGVEEVFKWHVGETMVNKTEPKLPGSGPHTVTGPVAIEGAMPGDVLQVDILEVDPRLNPATGKCYGVNAQMWNGYHFRFPDREGNPHVFGDGTDEAMTVMEFVQDEDSNMLWGKPVYMFRFPNLTLPDGSFQSHNINPSTTVPHVYNFGHNMSLLEEAPIVYPPGFDGFALAQDEIEYMSPDPAGLDWKVPLRPHMGVLAVTPANALNWDPENGLNTVPPARFGGNIDDWRIGKGGTMYYVVEIPGAGVYMGDTHAAQGDSELAGTAMETSLTAKFRFTLHKQDNLPKKVSTIDFPLLETSTEYVIHGFAYNNFLDDLSPPQGIFAEGATLDLAMEDCFVRTRNWLMDVYDLIEEETIALMTMGIDFGVTQVVDGNWGVHSNIPKWLFDESGAPFDYSCTTSKTAGRARRRKLLQANDRRSLLEEHGIVYQSPAEYADALYTRITKKCGTCPGHPSRNIIARKLLDAKLLFLHDVKKHDERGRRIQEHMERHLKTLAAKDAGPKLRG